MALRRKVRGVSSGRVCRMEGCETRVEAGSAYCRGHADDPEAVAFRRELAGAASYLALTVETQDADAVERAEAFRRFKARAQQGEFDGLLEAPTRRMLEQAAAVEGFGLEVGALRYGVMRVLEEETNPTRMALSLARLSNAVVRATGEAARLGVDGAGRREDEEDAFFGRAAMVLGRGMRGTDQRTALAAIRAGGPDPNGHGRWELARRMMAVEDAWLAEQAEAGAGTKGGDSEGRISERPGGAVAVGPGGWPSAGEVDAGWEEDDEEAEEDRLDTALALRIAAERTEAVRRSEVEREMSAYAVAGLERDRDEGVAGRRVARGG